MRARVRMGVRVRVHGRVRVRVRERVRAVVGPALWPTDASHAERCAPGNPRPPLLACWNALGTASPLSLLMSKA